MRAIAGWPFDFVDIIFSVINEVGSLAIGGGLHAELPMKTSHRLAVITIREVRRLAAIAAERAGREAESIRTAPSFRPPPQPAVLLSTGAFGFTPSAGTRRIDYLSPMAFEPKVGLA
jgi:hypothetical protein